MSKNRKPGAKVSNGSGKKKAKKMKNNRRSKGSRFSHPGDSQPGAGRRKTRGDHSGGWMT